MQNILAALSQIANILASLMGPVLAYLAGRAAVQKQQREVNDELNQDITANLVDDGAWANRLRDKAKKLD